MAKVGTKLEARVQDAPASWCLAMTLASSQGLGKEWANFCSFNALPPSDLVHDLFPGAILTFEQGSLCRHGVKDCCDPQKAPVPEHTKGLRLGGANKRAPGYFSGVWPVLFLDT